MFHTTMLPGINFMSSLEFSMKQAPYQFFIILPVTSRKVLCRYLVTLCALLEQWHASSLLKFPKIKIITMKPDISLASS